MGIIELLITAIALSMDAFAVAICKGLCVGKIKPKHMVICGLWFGGFQALMPLIGYFLGVAFADYINAYDHWIAFVLLGIIGGKMIVEALQREEPACDVNDSAFGVKTMLTMAIATSIDALAVGVGFAILPDVNISFAIASIGIITFLLSAVGVKIGSIFGAKYKFVAELVGGIALVGMGFKILIEHLFF